VSEQISKGEANRGKCSECPCRKGTLQKNECRSTTKCGRGGHPKCTELQEGGSPVLGESVGGMQVSKKPRKKKKQKRRKREEPSLWLEKTSEKLFKRSMKTLGKYGNLEAFVSGLSQQF